MSNIIVGNTLNHKIHLLTTIIIAQPDSTSNLTTAIYKMLVYLL